MVLTIAFTAFAGQPLSCFDFFLFHQRKQMEVLYAFTRLTDDLVDIPGDAFPRNAPFEEASITEKYRRVEHWRLALDTFLCCDEPALSEAVQKFGNDLKLAVFPALSRIVKRFSIPVSCLTQLIDGIRADIEPRAFASFDDCIPYCHHVATTVGLASLAIWGTREPLESEHIQKAAQACGLAFQWTNILRDLREDFLSGRVYLPQDELQQSQLSGDQWAALFASSSRKASEKAPDTVRQRTFLKLMEHQFHRCEEFYDQAAPLFSYINEDSRRVFGLMWSYYRKLLRCLECQPWQITQKRVRVSSVQKLRLILRWRFFPPHQFLKKGS